MTVYNVFNPEHDILLAQWYKYLIELGEMHTMFTAEHTLGSLIVAMRPPCICLFEHDEQGIWAVFWYEPAFSGAFFSVWVHPRKRASVAAVRAFRRAAESGLEVFPILMGVTKQEKLLPIHYKLGYSLVGKIPALMAGEDAYLLILTREKYKCPLPALSPNPVDSRDTTSIPS